MSELRKILCEPPSKTVEAGITPYLTIDHNMWEMKVRAWFLNQIDDMEADSRWSVEEMRYNIKRIISGQWDGKSK